MTILSLWRRPLPLPPMLVWSVRFVRHDDEFVALPTRARESPRYWRMPGADVRPAVGVDDARVVNHLVADATMPGACTMRLPLP
jgi:hypothetical protein